MQHKRGSKRKHERQDVRTDAQSARSQPDLNGILLCDTRTRIGRDSDRRSDRRNNAVVEDEQMRRDRRNDQRCEDQVNRQRRHTHAKNNRGDGCHDQQGKQIAARERHKDIGELQAKSGQAKHADHNAGDRAGNANLEHTLAAVHQCAIELFGSHVSILIRKGKCNRTHDDPKADLGR